MAVFHIAHLSDWDAALRAGDYRVSSRGLTLANVGFIHASESHQVASVAETFYRDDPEALVVLTIDEQRVADLRREEIGTGEVFPHIYGPIEVGWVTRVRPAAFVDGRFVISDD